MSRRAALACPSLALLTLFAGCASAPPRVTADRLAGCWAGEDQQPVVQRRTAWRMERRADGNFTVTFRPIEGPAAPAQVEQGRWSWQDGLYTTVTTRIDGRSVSSRDPRYTDHYEVKSLSDREMTYFHTGLKQSFTAQRVACDAAK